MTQLTLTRKIKQRITEDWHRLFPDLGVYKPMWLLRRCGPLVMGVCLDRRSGNDAYVPTAHLHCLAMPFPAPEPSLTMDQRLQTANGRGDDEVRVKWHEQRYEDAAARLAKQSLLPLSGGVSLEQLETAFRQRVEGEGHLLGAATQIYERWLLTLAWAGRPEEVARRLAQFRQIMLAWPEDSLHREGGPDAWARRMAELTKDPEQVRETVEQEAKKLGVEDLPAVDVSSWLT